MIQIHNEADSQEAPSSDAASIPRKAYGINRVAEMLDVSHWTVRRAIAAGEIKSFTVGNRRLVPAAEVHRLIGDSVVA